MCVLGGRGGVRVLIGYNINVQTLADLPFPHEAKKYCVLITDYTWIINIQMEMAQTVPQ